MHFLWPNSLETGMEKCNLTDAMMHRWRTSALTAEMGEARGRSGAPALPSATFLQRLPERIYHHQCPKELSARWLQSWLLINESARPGSQQPPALLQRNVLKNQRTKKPEILLSHYCFSGIVGVKFPHRLPFWRPRV